MLRFWEEKIIKGETVRTEFQWLTSIRITRKNAEKITGAGRKCWKIENEGFNRQKNWQGNITHACSWDATAITVFQRVSAAHFHCHCLAGIQCSQRNLHMTLPGSGYDDGIHVLIFYHIMIVKIFCRPLTSRFLHSVSACFCPVLIDIAYRRNMLSLLQYHPSHQAIASAAQSDKSNLNVLHSVPYTSVHSPYRFFFTTFPVDVMIALLKVYIYTNSVHLYVLLVQNQPISNGTAGTRADVAGYSASSRYRKGIPFHKPPELHKFIVNGKDGADMLIFSFIAEGPLTAYLEEKVFMLSDFQKSIADSLLLFIGEHLKPTADSEDLYRSGLEPFRTKPTYFQMLAAYLHQLMLSLADAGAVSAVSSAPDAVIFRQAISYLNSNIHRQPSVPELARFCNISESGLKRIFDKYAGIGIHKYLMKLKIKTAAELLQQGESVSCVAEKLGFNSQSYFSKAFRRETGVTPSSLK